MKNVKRHWFRIGTRLIVLVAAWCVGVVLAWAWQAPDPTPAMFGDYTWKAPLVQFARGSFNIGENESPAPQNRLFVNYNLFSEGNEVTNSHREMIGFEKTVLDRRISIGLRQPFFQIHSLDNGPNRYSASGVDDLNIILKYAPILHRENGSALSFGLVTTVPSSSKGLSTSDLVVPSRPSESGAFVQFVDELHTPIFQPFIGYIWTRRDLFVQGFSSVAIPADSNNLSIMFNGVGVGYWLYRGGGGGHLTAVIPTFEAHVNTPLSHRTAGTQLPPGFDYPDVVGGLPRFHDSVDLTGGVSFRFDKHAEFGIGIATTVTHPRLFNIEVIPRFNWYF